jgi:hypothetical protein
VITRNIVGLLHLAAALRIRKIEAYEGVIGHRAYI